MLHSGLHLTYYIFMHDVASAHATHTCIACNVPKSTALKLHISAQILPTLIQQLEASQLGGRHDSDDCHVKLGTAADDGELLMLERLSLLLRTDVAHAQQQVQQELAGMPAAHSIAACLQQCAARPSRTRVVTCLPDALYASLVSSDSAHQGVFSLGSGVGISCALRHLYIHYQVGILVDVKLRHLMLSTEPHRHASWPCAARHCRGMAGSCGQPDVWAGELPAKGQLAMAISLQAEILATTAKVCSNSFLCRVLLSFCRNASTVSLA